MDSRLTRYETPVSDELIQEIWEMWQKVPEDVGIGSDISMLSGHLTNRTRSEDRKLLYVARVDGVVAGTSMIWVSGRDPVLCEFGLPATAAEFRRKGIGQALFDAPVSDFKEMGGEAIFLGTNHVNAGRTYFRAGYRKLVASITHVRVLSGVSPEEYFVEFFRGLGPASVFPGEATDRTSAVPLVHSAHDWQVMDANMPTLSRRYFVHRGFAGQVGRYIGLLEDENATFFAARAGDRQKVVGLSSVKLGDDGVCSVDGFTHNNYGDQWVPLIEAAIEWGRSRGAASFGATVSVEDYEKRDLFAAQGFQESGSADDFFLDGVWLKLQPNGRPVGALRLVRA